ncbi:transmembrane protein C17orf113-like [Xenia sp. Carnegie-2017]|uniref:transmembrane protein C17orf113-like n=1 Tax=Xenia sp. Carnegie-2017 TaxID=2897299 RepID=UPI001F043E0F|nr:transmembrane protein C17orf113-like [Xenia sp. Carnegie-2017]
MASNRGKPGRHGLFLDKWLQEFQWLERRGTGVDLAMFCKDCCKAGKKNAFTTGCKNLQRSALVRHMTQTDHKSTAKVLNQQHRFKAAIDNASKLDEESLTKQMRTAYWLSKEEMPSSKFISLCELQALNGCTSLDPKAATGSIYHHHQSVSDMNAAFAEVINKTLMKISREKNIDCGNKLVGLGSDGASVMMGRHNGVGVRLKTEASNLESCCPTRWLSLHNAVDAIYKCWSALVDCLEHQAAEKNDENSTKAKGYLKQVQQYKFVAATCMMKDVLPTLTKLSLYFQRENVGISSVEPMVTSTITTLQTLRNDLGGDLANLPSLKELNQQLLTSDSYCEKELQQTSDNARQAFINSGQAFLAKLIENLQERFPSETLDICKALDIVVNPQSLPHTAADIAAHGIDALNKLVENYGQQKAVGDRNVDPLIDPEVTRADYLQFKFLLNTNRLLNMQEFSKKFLTDEGLCEQFPTFTALANIALTIPVSSAACERLFLSEPNQDGP